MEENLNIENFFGCYLLYNINTKYKGRIYIGFTNDPSRRIIQHNKGREFGGAKKTSNKGPWDMVLIIYGFPNKISALKFEWAWQNPLESRAIKEMNLVKLRREKYFDYSLRVLGHMLNSSPWRRLPLNICWLNKDYKHDFDLQALPPSHMPIIQDNVVAQKQKNVISKTKKEGFCHICCKNVEEKDRITCLITTCSMQSHIICLATVFLHNDGELIPIEGTCPKCHTTMLWGDLIRHKAGFLKNINIV